MKCAEHMEAPMTRLSLVAALSVWLGCGAGVAQVNFPGMTTPDMGAAQPLDSVGAPSPVGAMGSASGTGAPVGGAGIPLGTTELFAGGLSPAPTDVITGPTCPGAGANPGVGALGTGSLFTGNGTMATSTSDLASAGIATDSGCGAAASAGAGPLGVTSTLGTAPAFTGGSVPLGAAALNITGLSGTIGVPAPGSVSPCTNPASGTTLGTGFAPPGSIPLRSTPASNC
jgi:hypothetical protein